ncbi:MAG: hypothetical protein U0V03_00130 [Bacteroidia bacterium]
MINNILIICNVITVFLYSFFIGDGNVGITNNFPTSIKPGQTVAVELKVNKGNSAGFAKLQMDLPEGITVTEIDNAGSSYTGMDGIAKWVWSSLPSGEQLVVKFNIVVAASASGAKTMAAKYSYVEGSAKQVVEMTPVEIMIGDGAVANTTSTTPTNTSETPSTSPEPTQTVAAVQNTTSGAASPASNLEPNAKISIERTITKGATDNEQIVNLKINKGNTKGFGRYSDDLPAGYTAKSINTDGASFTTADEKIKFVWVNVPEKELLTISYAITSNNPATLPLNGEYAYLEENQSKKFLATPESIVFAGNTSNQTIATTTPTTEVKAIELAKTNTETVANNNVSPDKTTEANNSNTNIVTSTPTTSTPVTEPTNTSTEPVAKINNSTASVDFRVQIGAFSNSGVSASTLANMFNISDKISSEMQGGFSKFMIGNFNEYKAARDKRENTMNKGVKSAFVVAYNSGKRITVQEGLMLTSQKWFK